ncbi:MAG TPA: ABC transporter permease [Gemmatimonadaceae bacterium]|jgi:predicted permease
MLPRGIRRFFRIELDPRRVTRAIDDELRFHFDMSVRHYMSRGMSEADAQREAERRFGNVERTRSRLESIDRSRAEHVRRVEWWGGLLQDLRYALRGLRAAPSFTLVVILALALGIGANATMFGIIDRLLLRPPPFLADASHTNLVYLGRRFDGVESLSPNISYTRYVELTKYTTSFSETAAFFSFDLAVGTGEETAERRVGLVSASFWHLFDAPPALGRYFGPSEDHTPEGATVAVLGYSYWQTRYGGRADVLGKSISLGRRTYTIVGVAPRGFVGLDPIGAVAFVPITTGVVDIFGGGLADVSKWYTTHNMSWMEMFVRRKPGVSPEAAGADLTNAYRRSYLAQEKHAPIDIARPRAVVGSVLRERGPNQGTNSKVATWLVGVSLIVLIIACANVANLLLARAFRRRREIAVRVALGVSRGRLLVQLLTESMVLALLGAAAGLVVAQWGGTILRTAMLPDVEWPSLLADSRMLIFTGVAALGVGVLTGLAPALLARRTDVSAALKAGAREGTYHHSKTRTALLVIQGALSVLLLVGTGLFVRSLRQVHALDFGYDTPHILYVSIEMRGLKVDSLAGVALHRDLVERARSIPGVQDASLTVAVPFWMSWSNDLFTQARDSIHGDYLFNTVSPSYFATMGTRIVRGRGFTEADRDGAPPVLVISQSMARKLFPKTDALGQCIRVGADTVPCSTVIGVSADIVDRNLTDPPGLEYYAPAAQHGDGANGLFVRTRGDASEMTATVRRELQRVMPGVSYVVVTPLEKILEPNVRPWRLGATMFALFGGLALLLAAVGLYSVIAYNVTQRSHELGVRIALGAQGRDVLRLVVGSGLRIAVAGVAIGGGIALVAGRFIAPLLYRVSPKDPLIYVVAAVTLLGVAVLASLVPAMRATRVDPNVALRAD